LDGSAWLVTIGPLIRSEQSVGVRLLDAGDSSDCGWRLGERSSGGDAGRAEDLGISAARASGAYTRLTIGVERRRRGQERRREMILATTQVEDFDRFEKIFSTKGAEKRKQHGSKGATVFRDPNEDDRVWVLFDWDAEGWQSFVSDPEVPPIMQEAGHKGRPQAAELGGQYDA
jgi:hypothetical protein